MEDGYYVYVWTNSLNGKRYVGKGKGDRATEHLRPCRSNLLGRAIQKYGRERFSLTYLAWGLSEPLAFALEIAAIRAMGTKTPNGYNITDGGTGASGTRHSEETRRLMSEACKGNKSRTGRRNSAATRLRSSKTQRARYNERLGVDARREAVDLCRHGFSAGEAARRIGCSIDLVRRALREANVTAGLRAPRPPVDRSQVQKAVRMVADGATRTHAAKVCGLSDSVVRRAVAAYFSGSGSRSA